MLPLLTWPRHSTWWAEMAFSRSWPRLVVLLPYSVSWSPFMITWREQYDGATSDPFNILSGVKQCCVLAPTLFGIFFAILLKHAFGKSTEGIYLRTRSDGNLFKLSRLRAKTRVHEKYVRDLLFADDAAITTHTQEDLQRFLDRFLDACRHFGLTISIAKTQVMS